MPIQVSWYDPSQTIIYITLSPKWTWQEHTAARYEADELRQSVRHTVHYIIHYLDGYTPLGLLKQGHWILSTLSEDAGKIITVNPSSLYRVVMNTLSSFYPVASRSFVLVDTLQEALALIRDQYWAPDG